MLDYSNMSETWRATSGPQPNVIDLQSVDSSGNIQQSYSAMPCYSLVSGVTNNHSYEFVGVNERGYEISAALLSYVPPSYISQAGSSNCHSQNTTIPDVYGNNVPYSSRYEANQYQQLQCVTTSSISTLVYPANESLQTITEDNCFKTGRDQMFTPENISILNQGSSLSIDNGETASHIVITNSVNLGRMTVTPTSQTLSGPIDENIFSADDMAMKTSHETAKEAGANEHAQHNLHSDPGVIVVSIAPSRVETPTIITKDASGSAAAPIASKEIIDTAGIDESPTVNKSEFNKVSKTWDEFEGDKNSKSKDIQTSSAIVQIDCSDKNV